MKRYWVTSYPDAHWVVDKSLKGRELPSFLHPGQTELPQTAATHHNTVNQKNHKRPEFSRCKIVGCGEMTPDVVITIELSG